MRKDILNLNSTEKRTNENPDKDLYEKLAERLINNGEKIWIEDENLFKDVFILCSPEEMKTCRKILFPKIRK